MGASPQMSAGQPSMTPAPTASPATPSPIAPKMFDPGPAATPAMPTPPRMFDPGMGMQGGTNFQQNLPKPGFVQPPHNPVAGALMSPRLQMFHR